MLPRTRSEDPLRLALAADSPADRERHRARRPISRSRLTATRACCAPATARCVFEVIGPVRRAASRRTASLAGGTARAPLAAFGRFPVARSTRCGSSRPASPSRSPVPWGQTSRRDGVSVLLYVREDASFDELRVDWTAVHELSHLFHPYLGARRSLAGGGAGELLPERAARPRRTARRGARRGADSMPASVAVAARPAACRSTN